MGKNHEIRPYAIGTIKMLMLAISTFIPALSSASPENILSMHAFSGDFQLTVSVAVETGWIELFYSFLPALVGLLTFTLIIKFVVFGKIKTK